MKYVPFHAKRLLKFLVMCPNSKASHTTGRLGEWENQFLTFRLANDLLTDIPAALEEALYRPELQFWANAITTKPTLMKWIRVFKRQIQESEAPDNTVLPSFLSQPNINTHLLKL
jgi:hypothetical protein